MNMLEKYESLCTFHKMCHKVFESAVVLPEVIGINHLDLGTMVTCATLTLGSGRLVDIERLQYQLPDQA